MSAHEHQRSCMYTIGELAKAIGLPVKTIRFYSDSGLLPPTRRTAARYRLYTEDDRARLELIRTLRNTGLKLDTIRKVVESDINLSQAIRLQLGVVEERIRSLTRVRAVLRAALDSESPNASYFERLDKLAKFTLTERTRLVDDFLDRISDGIMIDQEWLAGFRQASRPNLPDDPTEEQLDAWLELAQLLSDPQYERRIREMSQTFWTETQPDFDREHVSEIRQKMIELATAAIDAGIPPSDPRARPAVDLLVEQSAEMMGRPADADFRSWLHERIEAGAEPRAERYWELLAVINGSSAAAPTEDVKRIYRWLYEGLRHLITAESA